MRTMFISETGKRQSALLTIGIGIELKITECLRALLYAFEAKKDA